MSTTAIDLWEIVPRLGSQDESFEEFCCQLARHEQRIPANSTFTRLRGTGGDGGVECYFVLPDGTEWGWQAKFVDFAGLKASLDKSIKTALVTHPRLRKYIICIPFDLTGPTRGKGKSQKEKFDAYRDEWEKYAIRKKIRCEFELWSASDLLERLNSIDPGGGRRSFWFDETYISDLTLYSTIDKAVCIAGPRYTSDLNIDVPLSEAIEAIGQSEAWNHHLLAKKKTLRKLTLNWAECIKRLPTEMHDALPDSTKSIGNILHSNLLSIEGILSQLIETGLSDFILQQLQSTLEASCKLADECVAELEKDLVQKHGASAPKSIGFRQFSAEYMVSFPAQNYDDCSELRNALAKFLDWSRSPHLAAASKKVITILGKAGSGKTHSLCHAAIERRVHNLPTCLLLGEQVTENSFWRCLAEKLNLPTDTPTTAILDALNCRGEASGKPLLIVVDGINETKPDRSRWQTWLPEIQHEISKRTWLRFVASCRTSYRNASIPKTFTVGEFEHKGFEGLVSEACNKFFAHYSLNSPGDPLLHSEFENPLFLKLLCSVMLSKNLKTLPVGWTGFYQVYEAFLSEINNKYSIHVGTAEANRYVYKAIRAFANKCSDSCQDYLIWSVAQEAIESVLPNALRDEKLLGFLISENVLRTDGCDDSNREEFVRIAFEKLSDYMIAEMLLEPFNSENIGQAFSDPLHLGRIIKTKEDLLQNKGICEALATLLPERFQDEFCSLVENTDCKDEALKCLVESLKFRSPECVNSRTIFYIRKALSSDLCYPTMDALLALSTRETCQINADFLDDLLRNLSLSKRDAFWCTYTHLSYDENGVVYKLCNQPLSLSKEALPKRSIVYLWSIVLLWFCSAADRRIRDTSTKALVALTENCPEVWLDLLNRFLDIDDDYILERALAACYGTLLRKPSSPCLMELGWLAYFNILKRSGDFQNACILDHARAITFMAKRRGQLGTSITNMDISPPYPADWPLSFESKEVIKEQEGTDERIPKLFRSCFEDDFFTYIIPHALGAYNEALNSEQIASWVFSEAMRLSNEDSGVIHYDGVTCSKFGRGRGRKNWAERIGKKYQWIALRRLVARVAGNCLPKQPDWGTLPKEPPMLWSHAADLDPSILVKHAANERKNPDCWWNKKLYSYAQVETLADKDWIKKHDFPDPRNLIGPHKDSWGNSWIVLETHPDWRHVADGEGDIFDKKYRDMWIQVRSYFLSFSDLPACLKMLSSKNFYGRWMPEGLQLHDGYIGEYPWGIPFCSYEEEYREYNMEENWKGRLTPTANSLTINYTDDCYQESPINILIPNRHLCENYNLSWNSVDGFCFEGKDFFRDPSILEAGPSSLLMCKEKLGTYLTENNLAIVWTILGEKIASKGHNDFLRLEYSNHVCLQNDTLKVMKPRFKLR